MLTFVTLVLAAGPGAEYAHATSPSTDPLFVFTPVHPPLPAPAIPPPTGYLNDPCGIAVDSAGRFYVADYTHDVVDVYDQNADYNGPKVTGATGYLGQLAGIDPLDGPCALSFDSADRLYVDDFHRAILRYGAFGSFGSATTITGASSDGTHPTGVALDPATNRVYVDQRSYVSVFEEDGEPVSEEAPPGSEILVPLQIGKGSLEDGYGIAVSSYPGTAGYLYVPDAADDTIEVYDPATSTNDPVAEIDGSETPAGKFSSLREASIAVDRGTGEIYVLDDLQAEGTESPHGLVDVFDHAGGYEGHLKYEIVDGRPSGLAVDNTAGPTQGRVYVTSGNTHLGAIYAYPPGAATTAAPLLGSAPPPPLGGTSLFPTVAIGGATESSGTQIACEGDACQILPPEPQDPPLSTKVVGLGNPRIRYARYGRHRRPRKSRHRRHHSRHRPAGASVATPASPAQSAFGGPAGAGSSGVPPTGHAPRTAALSTGFSAEVIADGGAPAAIAGSHPYALDLSLGLDQGAGASDLRDLRLELPPDMILDPAATGLCSASSFATPRSSPFEASKAGESCQARSQIGTLDVEAGGDLRRFGLFQLQPADGDFARIGAAPFGAPIVFDVHLFEGGDGSVHLLLESSQVSQGLALHGLALTFWGIPWDATHSGERGNCLNEAEPSFPWAKCDAVGEPVISSQPLAFLTLPTVCGAPLSFSADAESWAGAGLSEEAQNRDSGGEPVAVEGCDSLHFEPAVDGALSTNHVSSPSGFAFHLSQDDPGFVNPRDRAEPRTERAVVELPEGVTLNPSLGAGLEGCTPAQLAAETLTDQGCPNGSKIGSVLLRLPFFKGEMKGAIYLAKPLDNPYGSLIAVYLVVKAADRGILLKAQAKLTPNPSDGTITASFEHLTQLPYGELKLEFRAGQRAALVSPPSCAVALIQTQLTSWSGAMPPPTQTESPLEAGIEGAPCPTGTPPFRPKASAGGINSNANSYTPYFIHLSRSDSEQEITSYSLVLPAGITGKLAGIPFCSDAAIAAARERPGFAEAADPSCPAASRVGATVSGYGVGPALAYSKGAVYLAGPYHGAPLSLVTINPATVGPFDLGTIVVRSAFDLDPRTAQLRIDSSASDPIPHILDGVVLHLRDIRVYLDRPEFTHNPTSCEPSQLESTLTGAGASFEDPADDSTAGTTDRFQLLNCRNLGFHPKLGLRLLGSSRRRGFPALRATFAARGPRDANLEQIEVDLPHQLFLAQEHIRAICSRSEFDAERCPPGSVYGTASAYTPLLDQPLRGDVYLRSSQGRLPDLVADLRSGSIRIILEGEIGPTKDGGVRAYFADLPDAPIERFTMLMAGGKHGLFTNSVDVCRRPPRASVKALGQNNTGAVFTSVLRGGCSTGTKHRGGGR